MQPTIGRVVIATGSAAESNGAKECPALITRVFNQVDDHWVVNLMLFPDAAIPRFSTSAYLFDTEDEARAYGPSTGAYWPPRV